MHYFFRDQWFATDEEVRAHIAEGEPVNPAGSFIWLKLDSAQTPLHRKVSLNDLCLALILLEDIFRIAPPLLKCVLNTHLSNFGAISNAPKPHIQLSLCPALHISLHCFTSSGSHSVAFSFSSSHPLFPALHLITPLSHSHPSLLLLLLLQPFHLTIFFFPFFHSLSQNALYLLSRVLLSKKLLYPATIKKASLFKQVLQFLNLWREAGKSWGTPLGFSF